MPTIDKPPDEPTPRGGAQTRSSALEWVIGISAAVIGGLVTALVAPSGGAPEPLAVATLLVVVVWVVAAWRYWTMLGYAGAAPRSLERREYLRLRGELRGERSDVRVGRLYAEAVRAVLGKVDRFFGDAPAPEAGGQPPARRRFWSATAFDRCLLLALLYPILTVFLVWVVSGETGRLEQAMLLGSDVRDEMRWLLFGLAGAALVCGAASGRSTLLFFAGIGLAILAGTFAIPLGWYNASMSVVVALSLGFCSRLGVPGVGFALLLIVYVTGFTVQGLLLDHIGQAHFTARVVTGLPLFVCAMATLFLVESAWFKRWSGRGTVQTLVWFMLLGVVFAGAALTAGTRVFLVSGPLLMFMGLLAVINTPFDWLTLGTTRALLHAGLARGRAWPLLFGLLDLIVAIALMIGLAVAMLLAVRLYNTLTLARGGFAILELETLLAAIAEPSTRWRPEQWWVYIALFSTLVPSWINAAIGAVSVLRGVPGLNGRLGERLPKKRALPDTERSLVAAVLALQLVGGLVLAFAALAAVSRSLFVHLLPFVGVRTLELLTWVERTTRLAL